MHRSCFNCEKGNYSDSFEYSKSVDLSPILHAYDWHQKYEGDAEDFYNSCALAWNVWSNYEVWYRMHTADYLCDDDEIVQSIKSVSVDIIKNKNV